jgi:hypothetical protein
MKRISFIAPTALLALGLAAPSALLRPESRLFQSTPPATTATLPAPRPTPTQPPAIQPTGTPLPPAPTAVPGEAGVTTVSHGFFPGGDLRLAVAFPGPVQALLENLTGELADPCRAINQHGQDVYCVSPVLPRGKTLTLRIFLNWTDRVAFLADFILPATAATATPVPAMCTADGSGFTHECQPVPMPGCESTQLDRWHGVICFDSCGRSQASCVAPVESSTSQ